MWTVTAGFTWDKGQYCCCPSGHTAQPVVNNSEMNVCENYLMSVFSDLLSLIDKIKPLLFSLGLIPGHPNALALSTKCTITAKKARIKIKLEKLIT